MHGEKVSYWREIKKTFDEIPEQIKEERLRGIHSTEIDFRETEIILAFPRNDDGSADASKEQPVFAFLPVTEYGFKFIIQADFLLPVSREDIINDNDYQLYSNYKELSFLLNIPVFSIIFFFIYHVN